MTPSHPGESPFPDREILDPETFYRIQEIFSKATSMAATTFDKFLLQICPSSHLNPFCSKLLNLRNTNPDVAKLCLNAHFDGLKEALRQGKNFHYQCYLGLENTAVPLMVNGQAIGGISSGQVYFEDPKPENFDVLEKHGLNKDEYLKIAKELKKVSPSQYEQWIELLASMTNSVLRDRASQLEEKKRVRRLAFISELSRHIGEDLQNLLDFIAHSLPEACELEKCTVFLLDEKKGQLVAKASNAFGKEDLQGFIVSVKNKKGDIVVDSEPFVSPDASNDPRLVKEYVEKCQIKSLLTVPLKVRERVLGVIHFVDSEKHHYFSPEEIQFINALAAEVSLAVESTFQEEERRTRAEELEQFRQEVRQYFTRIGKAISSAFDTEGLLYLVSDLSMRAVKGDGCSVYLLQDSLLEKAVMLGDVPARDPFTERIFSFPDSVLVETLKSSDGKEVWTTLRIPLKTQEAPVGILNVYARDARMFSDEEKDVLSAFAAQAGLSIQNVRLFHAEQAKAREISVVYEAAAAISTPKDLNLILMETAQRMCALGGANRCFIFLLDEERKVLTTALVHGVTAEQREFFSALAIPLNFLEGLLWQRFKEGGPVVLKSHDISRETGSLKNLFSVFGTKSCLLVPLLGEKKLAGLIYLDEEERAHEFSESEIRSMSALSIHAATAIQKAQFYKQLEDQSKQVHTLYQISTALSTSLNLDRILRLIIEKTTQLVHAERFCLFMWDDSKNGFVVAASHGLSEEFIKKATVKIEDRFVGLASYKKKPVYSANILLETDNPQLARLFKKEGLGAVLAVPLVTKRKTIGVITYFAELGYQFKEKEVHLLGNFAGHAALSIENARLYNQNRQKVQELGILFDVGKHISEHLNPQEVLRAMAEQFSWVMRADGCSIMLLNKDEKTLSILATRGVTRRYNLQKKIKLGEGFVGKVFRTGQPLVIYDQGRDGEEYAFPKGLRQEGVTTILSIPLATKEELLGVVNLYTKERRQYAVSEMHLMQTLAAQGAVALRNAGMFHENYNVAQLIHRSLLPSRVPAILDCEFGFQYLPSQEISGDYYDFLEMRGKLGITIADVSGKGSSAAIFTAQAKYAWKAYGLLENDPQKVLLLLNRLMVESTPSEKFVSMFYGVLDLKKKEFVYSNAGHLPPLLYRAEMKRCRLLNVPGLLLGVDEKADFAKRSVNLHSGDILLFYTDGATEARNESGEIFGIERLENALEENVDHAAQVIANRILATVRQFARRRRLEDDITLVILKIK